MDNEKRYTEGIHISKSRQGGRLDNFWYHYKWPVIGLAVFLLIVVICIAQSCSKEKEDVVLMYAGPCLMKPNELSQVAELLSGVMPYDFDENGEKKVSLSTYHIYSREQIEQIMRENPQAQIDTGTNSSELQSYQTYIKTGESAVYFLDPWLYESLRDDPNEPLQKLSYVLAETPDGALEDGYGVRLGDTELYKKYEILQVLPADTIICLSRPYAMGKSSKKEHYRHEAEMFATVVDGKVKEDA